MNETFVRLARLVDYVDHWGRRFARQPGHDPA